ncbi:hypothetical protein LCGC14_1439810 [marine sediment metagenome]|uniref:Uncharacterized protein n=1 Tax=marine sediment metagenome TaxID=412755 RepID=A0A0F9M1K8_9ZZZZ
MRTSRYSASARSDEAKSTILGVLDCDEYAKIPYRLADAWEINSSHLSKLLIHNKLTPTMDDLLVEKGLLPKKPPKDPRPREWMRTDSAVMAVGKVLQHYDISETAIGLKANLRREQLSQLIKLLRKN